jgi:hypothetical protein
MVIKKHETKTCPRCNGIFECRVNDIVNCQCQGIIIGGDVWEFISNLYSNCLCKNCLLEINKKYKNLQ